MNRSLGHDGDDMQQEISNAHRSVRQASKRARKLSKKARKKAAKNATKNAGKAALKATTAPIKTFLAPFLPTVLFVCIVLLIVYNTPAIIANYLGDNFVDAENQQEYQEAIQEWSENARAMETLTWDDNAIMYDEQGNYNPNFSISTWANNLGEYFKLVGKQFQNGGKIVKSLMVDVGQRIGVSAKNWYYDTVDGEVVVKTLDEEDVVTEEELQKIAEAGNYDELLKIDVQIIQHYLENAYDENMEAAQADAASIGDENYDAEMTAAAMANVGNPFTNVNYAALLAAYATSDDYSYGTLARFKGKLHDADFLNYELTDPMYQDVIIPTTIYKYDAEDKEVDTIEWLKLKGTNSEEMKTAVIASKNTQIDKDSTKVAEYNDTISSYKSKRDSLQEQNDSYQSKVDKLNKEIKKKKKKINEYKKKSPQFLYKLQIEMLENSIKSLQEQVDQYNADISYNQSKIDDYDEKITSNKANKNTVQDEINQLNADIAAIQNGTKDAVIEDVIYYDEKTTVTLYKMAKDEDGDDAVYATANEPNNPVIAPHYTECDLVSGDYYYMDTENYEWYPEIETHTYYSVVWSSFSETDVLSLFGVDKDAVYSLSEGYENEEKNIEVYSDYYTTLEQKIDSSMYTFSTNGKAYGETLTEEDIQGYLDNMPEGTSKNRKQIAKLAMAMVGRIPYEFGGRIDAQISDVWNGVGWNPDWGSGTGNPSYPYVGLDCSGFVQWVVRNALRTSDGSSEDAVWNVIGYTGAITSNCTQIAEKELKVGDLGTIRIAGSSGTSDANHVGIYIGDDSEGNHIWVHCTGGNKDTVVIGKYSKFQYFFRLPTESLEGDNYWTDELIPSYISTNNVTDDEFTILMMTCLGESNTSDDGFRAVAECFYNHAKANNVGMIEQFKSGKYSAAYKRLYIDNDEAFMKSRGTPTSTQIEILNDVLAGNIQILDTRVQYFRAATSSKLGSPYVEYGVFGGNRFYYIN